MNIYVNGQVYFGNNSQNPNGNPSQAQPLQQLPPIQNQDPNSFIMQPNQQLPFQYGAPIGINRNSIVHPPTQIMNPQYISQQIPRDGQLFKQNLQTFPPQFQFIPQQQMNNPIVFQQPLQFPPSFQVQPTPTYPQINNFLPPPLNIQQKLIDQQTKQEPDQIQVNSSNQFQLPTIEAAQKLIGLQDKMNKQEQETKTLPIFPLISSERDNIEEIANLIKLKANRKKHWPIKFMIQVLANENQLPSLFEIDVQSSLKVRQLKQIISEKLNGAISADYMSLKVKDSFDLDKNQKCLLEYDLQDGQIIQVEKSSDLIDNQLNLKIPIEEYKENIIDRIKKTQEEKKAKKRWKKKKPKVKIETTNEIKIMIEGTTEQSIVIKQDALIRQLRSQLLEKNGFKKDEVKIRLTHKTQELQDPYLKLSELDLTEDQITAEFSFDIKVEVEGKGNQYSQVINVKPEDTLYILKSKVDFVKVFLQRNFILTSKVDEKITFKDLSQTFQELKLKNGAIIVLKPQKLIGEQ